MLIYRAIARNYIDSIVNEVAHGHDSTIGGKGKQGLVRPQNCHSQHDLEHALLSALA